jgi:putative ABC transport system permease protein
VNWWQRVWRGKQMEEQLEKELRFHLDEHVNQLIAQGNAPDMAQRNARLALGGPEQVKEKCRDARGTRWLEDLLQDFSYALRTLRQRPGFAAVAILTLALGSGATTVMFTVVNGVLLKPLAYPEADRLVTLHGKTEQWGEQWGFSYPEFHDYQSSSRTLGSVAAWTYGGGTITKPGEAEYLAGRHISPGLFSVLGVPPAAGRAFLPQEDQPGAAPVAIISYRLWEHRFGGGKETIGRQLVFDGKSYTIVGIAPAEFSLDGEADIYTPLGQSTDPRLQDRAAFFLHVLGRLQPNVTLAQAQTELLVIAHRLAVQYPKENQGRDMVAHPLSQEVVGDVRPTLWLLLGAVSLVLLIACVNVASLLLARAVSRERELAMRVALGASRGRLARQCLTESSVLGILGGALGILLAFVGVHPFVSLWPGSLPRAEAVQLDWRVLLFALGVSLLSSLLFGLAPALRAPARELERALRSGGRNLGGSTRRLHSVFVVAEVALAVVLLVSAGILGRTMLRLSSLDPGFNTRNVLAAHVALSPAALENPATARAAWEELLDRARHFPGVQSIALADVVPMRVGEDSVGYWTTPVQPPPDQTPLALTSIVTPDYLNVMGIRLRKGRFINEQDRIGHEPVVVIDDNLAQRAFGGSDPVGKPLWLQGMPSNPAKIVGVVAHVRHWGLAGDDQSRVRDQIYVSFYQLPDRLVPLLSSVMSITVRTSITPLNIAEPLRRELRGPGGDQTLYDVHTMDDLARTSLDRQRFLLWLFGIFAGLALLLACIGIYGVLTYLTNQRVPEIGLRMALGASARDVMRLVLGQSFGMIVVGIGAGILGALAAGLLLQHLVDGTRPTDLSTFALMIPVLLAAALFASFIPARRASRVDPISALRQE